MVTTLRRRLHWSILGLVVAAVIALASVVSSPTYAAPLREPIVNSDPAAPATEPVQVERVVPQGDQAPNAAYPLRTLYSYGYYPPRSGAVHFIFTSADIHANSIVSASISEVDAFNRPWFGAAQLNIANITTSEGKVDMWVNIGWGSPLPSKVSFVILQP